MANLVIKFADLSQEPVGSGNDVSAEVLVSYTREVPLTDGTVLQAVPTRKLLGAGGTATFEVTPSDDPTVVEAHRGFGLRVEWLLTHRAGRGRQTETRGARTVKVLASDGATVQFGTLLPAEPLPPNHATVGEILEDVDQAVATIDNLAATATTLPPGSPATVTVTGAMPNKTINFAIPSGEPGMGHAEGQALLDQNAATLAAAESAATDTADTIRDNLATDISTPGNPAYEALVDVAGTITDPQTAGMIADTGSATRAALDGVLEADYLATADADGEVAAQVSDSASATAAALDLMQPHVSAAIHGMSTTNTGAQNKAALLAAHAAADGRAVYIPEGTFDLEKITDTEFGATPLRLVGAGARVISAKRWVLADARWQTDGPTGTVLRCSSTLAAGEPFIHIGSNDNATSTSLHSLALLGQGLGTGLKAGQDIGSLGGGWPLRWDFQGLTIANFDIGMTHTGENGVLIAPYIVGCGDGFYAGYPWNGNTVIGVNVERVTRTAIRLDHAITNVFMGGVLQASYPQLATIRLENSSLGNVFEGLYCENYAPTQGDHPGVLHEVEVGPPGVSGPCYGNKFRNMHWGAQTSSTPENRIIVHNAYFTEVTMDHGASGTRQPTVHLDGGFGHDVQGIFPDVVGAAKSRSRVRHTIGATSASDITETYGWNLATEGFLRVGNAVASAMPDPVKAGAGAIHRDQQSRVLMDSDGSGWAPIASRFVPFSTGAGGSLDGSTGTGLTWLQYTHLKFTAATRFALWPASSATQDRAYFVRNGKTTGNVTVSVQTGETLDGTTNGTVTLAAGQGMWFTVSAATSAWISA